MDERATWPPAPTAAYLRLVAASGPKMLDLAGEIADGALPAMLPPEFTSRARQTLGPDKLPVVGLSVAEAGEDLVNTVVAHGDPAGIAAQVGEHLDAGADHVALLPPLGGDFATVLAQLEEVASACPARESRLP